MVDHHQKRWMIKAFINHNHNFVPSNQHTNIRK